MPVAFSFRRPFSTFHEATARNPSNGEITLCSGPWAHGQWNGGSGMTTMGNIHFGQKTEEYYREFIEAPFFRRHLDTPSPDVPTPPPLPAAVVFEVGTNVWRRYEQWPPGETIKKP